MVASNRKQSASSRPEVGFVDDKDPRESPGPKRKRSELDRLGIKAARLHYVDGKTLADTHGAMRADGDDVRGPRDVSILLSKARGRGLVKLSLRVYGPTAEVDPDLSSALADRANLPLAIVAATGDLAGAEEHLSTDPAVQKKVLDESDLLHLILGRVAANAFLSALRPGDRIGVGSGRGVGFTVDALSLALRNNAYRECSIVSLVGGMTRVPWAGYPENLDADNNAGKLAAVLGGDQVDWSRLTTVQLPTFLSSERDLIVKTEAPHLLDVPLNRPFLDICLIGLGVLNNQHHLIRGKHPEVKAISPQLKLLRERVLPSCPGAVIDICESFWAGDVTDELAPSVELAVRTLNSHVVSAAPEKLARVRERLLVAGTAQKYQALKQCLLDRTVVRPTILVTDECSARRVLREL